LHDRFHQRRRHRPSACVSRRGPSRDSRGLAHLINGQEDLEVCGLADTAETALAGIGETRPEAVVVDISLGESSGMELIKSLKALYPDLPILVLSTYSETLYAERALRAGASGYAMKQSPTREVMEAIRRVLRGEFYLSPAMSSQLLAGFARVKSVRGTGGGVEQLTDRELVVFELIGRGVGTREIADRLKLSVSTIETHRAHIKKKLSVKTATELVRQAVDWVGRAGG
jgi:DNA-binding NarL/FixJ family response regulator